MIGMAPGGRVSCCAMALIWLAALLPIVAGCRMPHVEAANEPEGPATTESGDPVAEDKPQAPAGQPDGEAALAIADVGGVERDGRLKFVVSLSGGGDEPVTVAYATEDGTATAGRDYVTANGTLTFAAAAAETKEIEVLVRDDAVAEARETFTVRLSEAHGAKLSVAAAVGTIDDDDRRSVAVYPAELNVREGAAESYTVALGSRPTAPVTVTVAAPEELSAAPDEVVFTAADWRTARTVTVTAEEDEDALADAPVELTQVASGGGYDGVAVAAVTVTIVENDVTTLAVGAASAVEAAGRMRFEVSLSLANDNVVTVEYATGAAGDTARAGADYAPASGMLSFPAGSTTARMIEVVVHDDRLDEAAEELTVTLSNPVHAVLAGGGDRATATGTIEDDDEAPKLTIADGSGSEGDASLTFTVALDQASGRPVTVRYATADGTAIAATDYTAASGELRFEPGRGLEQTVTVPIANDGSHEPEETFTVTLSAAVNATISAPGGTATGTIEDDDEAPKLTIADSRGSESDASLTFTVALDQASGRPVTVRYATADGTAIAGTDYTAARGELGFEPGPGLTQTITVPIANDGLDEPDKAFTVTLSAAVNATIAALGGTATGTIEDDDRLELKSLEVTGGATAMYPDFSAEIFHYALTCDDSSTLQVTAEALSSATNLTLLRHNPSDNHTSTGNLDDVQVEVDEDHDIVIRIGATADTKTYVVHCLPRLFPVVVVNKKDPSASDGLLFLTPIYGQGSANPIPFLAIMDYHGVPRFHQYPGAVHLSGFQRHADKPFGISYSYYRSLRGTPGEIVLLDEQFEELRTVQVVAPLSDTNRHDFLITENGFLLISYDPAVRDFTKAGGSRNESVRDSVIQEVTPDGVQEYVWNSYDNLNLSDCGFPVWREYAHLNSFVLIEGDIVASFRLCNQVLRIARSEKSATDPGTRVIWQVGGRELPAEDSDGRLYLDLVDDPAGEFCGQHAAKLYTGDSNSEYLVLFDNGVHCAGSRKILDPFSRVVEYEIDLDNSEARWHRQFELPEQYGYSNTTGSVSVLDNGHWMISWNNQNDFDSGLGIEEISVVVSEVDLDGNEVFRLNMYAREATPGGGLARRVARTIRVLHEAEDAFDIPLNLP